METIKSLLVVGYILHILGLVSAGCKGMVFKELFENKALQGHVFKTEWASSDGHCESKCFLDDRCIAYSFGLAANGKKYMCELSDSDHVMHAGDLVERDGTIYRRAQNNCKCKSFQVCKVNFEDDTHQCECKPRFTGSQCDIAIKPCDSSPCQNAGTCVNELSTFTFTCTCAQGYTGSFCETEINGCLSNPCQNGGTCNRVYNGGYTCSCTNAIGVHCEARYVQGSGSWSSANTDCLGRGGNLPSIHSAADNSEVLKVLNIHLKESYMWIGLQNSTGNEWSEWSDGTPLKYKNFDADHPKSWLGCACMSSTGIWYSYKCSYDFQYVCVFK